LLIIDRVYRGTSDAPERVALEQVFQGNTALKELLDGAADYKLQVEFHRHIHDWLFSDVLHSLKPRILVFKRDAP